MNNGLSLISIMRNDPDFSLRIAKKTQEIKEDKQHLVSLAEDYSKRYAQEIKEGTEFRNRLLTEGTQKGLSEDEIMASYGKFVPAKQTPILNLLYFMLRESDNDAHYGRRHYERRNQLNESVIKNGHSVITETYNRSNLNELSEDEAEQILNNFIDEQFAPASSPARKQLNSIMGDEERVSSEMKEPDDMETLLYGELTLSQFDILKKLKALAICNNNSHESFLAWKKGQELCKKYSLEWDKIPCSILKK